MSEQQEDKTVLGRVEGYLDEAERSLALPSDRKREVVDEMRADILALVAGYRDTGCSESEAVDLALAEMGPVGEVSREIGAVVPPCPCATSRTHPCATWASVRRSPTCSPSTRIVSSAGCWAWAMW